jgi:predicted peptidase
MSMGGEGSWDALTYYPDLFAAALILNGAGDPRAMGRVTKLPIRFYHGRADKITPVANSRELAQINRNARQVFDRIAREAASHDISKAELWHAVGRHA